MMWNKSVKILTGQKTEPDEDGFDISSESYLENVPANFTTTTRNDQIIANQSGYSADQNIEIAVCNYNGESILIYEETGYRYEVKRTFQSDKSMNIVLTCERRERDEQI